jgi:cyclic pyranopterin phosphate synthase
MLIRGGGRLRDLTLTPNGVLLERQAGPLADAGLRRISVSLDSHDESVFRRMSGGRAAPGPVLAGIQAALRAGLAPVKVNCVVQRGVNDGGIVELARSFKGTGIVLRFIEFMDVGTLNDWNLSQVVTAKEILERIDAELALEPLARSYAGEVASRYRYRDGSGEIGDPVRSPLRRLHAGRLTTDGW